MTYGPQFSALADPSRLAIFEHLRERPRSVGELASALPISQPAVSQHLRVLRDAGLVERRKHGTRRIYALRAEGVAELRAYVESLWDDVLSAFQANVAIDPAERGQDDDLVDTSTR